MQGSTLWVAGWAADTQTGSPVQSVTVFVDGANVGTATLGIARPDVASYFNRPDFMNSGWSFQMPASGLSFGQHTVTVTAVGASGTLALGPKTFTVTGQILGSLDIAGNTTNGVSTVLPDGTLWVAGWAADTRTGSPVQSVTVFVDGANVGTATLGIARSDVAAYFNRQDFMNSGWSFQTPASAFALGQHNATVTAVGTSGTVQFGPRTFNIATAQPPSLVSVTPTGSTGSQQTFTFVSSDANGGADISSLQVLFANASGGNSNACYFLIDRQSSGILLWDDVSSNWGQQSVTAGGGGTLSNPQCSLSATGSSIAVSGVNLTVKLAVTFYPAYAGPHNITMEAADWTGLHVGPATMGTWTVPAPPPTTVTVTLTSVPTGLGLTVDGASCTTTCTFQWAPQSSHTIAASSPQNGMTGTRYVFAGWSDGGAQSHSITTPASATTYTASFTTQYLLTTTAASGGAIAPNSGWYNAGTSMTVTASPSSGYVFTGFSGALSGTNNAQQLTINGPASVAANFAILTTMAAQSMGSLPTGCPKSSTDFYILNDGTQKTLPYYLYEKKTGKPLDASKIDPSSLSAGSNVTVTLGSVPSLCAPGDNSVFDLTFSATSLASTGAHTVSFVWNGEPVQTVTLSGAFSVKDATPHINPVQQFPPAPNGSFYSTLYGTNFGPAPGSVAACVQGASQCNGTPDMSVTVRAGQTPDCQYCYWGDNQVNVLLTPSPTASGIYDLQLTSGGETPGQGFQTPPGQTAGQAAQSNRVQVSGGCPTSVVLSGTTDLRLDLGLDADNNFPHYLTGVGILATMFVGPVPYVWNGARITESLSTVSDTCPVPPFPTPCTGSDTFTVGPPGIPPSGSRYFGTIVPSLGDNSFYDTHATLSTADLLGVAGVGSCTTKCAQRYTCGGTTIGNFTITRTYTQSVIGATSVTKVGVTKQRDEKCFMFSSVL